MLSKLTPRYIGIYDANMYCYNSQHSWSQVTSSTDTLYLDSMFFPVQLTQDKHLVCSEKPKHTQTSKTDTHTLVMGDDTLPRHLGERRDV